MQGIILLDIVVDNLTTLNGLNAFLIGGFVLLCVGYWRTNGTNISGYNTAVRPSRATLVASVAHLKDPADHVEMTRLVNLVFNVAVVTGQGVVEAVHAVPTQYARR